MDLKILLIAFLLLATQVAKAEDINVSVTVVPPPALPVPIYRTYFDFLVGVFAILGLSSAALIAMGIESDLKDIILALVVPIIVILLVVIAFSVIV